MSKKNVVTIGGGTGSFVLLSGLKNYPINISAIVSMADDGGSTGILRDELGVLPPGDVRQCLLGLSMSSTILKDLMKYRFDKGTLKGHNFGNIFMAALEKATGDFNKGVEEISKILDVKGEVIPVVNKSVRLHIKLKNGKTIIGENELDHNEEIRKVGVEKVSLKPSAPANKRAIEKIKKADLIVMGLGDHYGSIVPNLLVKGIPEALRASRAKLVYVCNPDNKKGQTDGFSLEKYVAEINRFIGCDRVDIATFNNKKIDPELIRRYQEMEGDGVMVKIDGSAKNKYKIIKADLLQVKNKKIG